LPGSAGRLKKIVPQIKTEMSHEIRIRNADPKLIEKIKKMSVEFNKVQVTDIITCIILRWDDMKKRVAEQNAEIGKLAGMLRKLESQEANLKADFNDHVNTVRQQLRDAERTQKEFGTLKGATRRPARPGRAKIVPSKKAAKKK
jgi:hypothetical protein